MPPRPRFTALAALLVMLAPVYASAGERVHVVGKGQTLVQIAKRYHVTVDAIREANGLRPHELIHPGLSLTIPGKDGPAKDGPVRKTTASLHPSTPADRRGARGKGERGAGTTTPLHPRRGFVTLMRGSEKVEAQFLTRHGRLAPGALAGLRRVLRFYPTGAELPIDPRLAALVAQVSDHFGGRPLHVVSGFRPYSPVQYTAHSNHNVGRAMDFAVEGVPNTTVRDFCKTFRNAGVGYYPNSTFVHLDVRTGKAYWIDYSHPGEAPHYDSPAGQGSADEAAGDVEPHPGAADAPAPAP
jgi:uncharacterized protein YcbK (DUF882 family)